MPEVSVVGDSSSPCSFVSWDMPSRCARFAEAWPPAKESFVTWVCPRLRLAPRWPTPTNIGLGSCAKRCLTRCWQSARPWWPANQERGRRGSLVSRTRCWSLDASVIDLCATMFDWAKFRLTKGAVKLHLLLDHDGYLPSFAVITEGKKHEVRVARQMPFAPGAILVFDRGYTDYEWFTSLTAQGVYFVIL